MNTDRELMQQALEALEWNLPVIEDYGDHEQLNRQHQAITALRERLAQPEQERWVWRNAAIRVGEELSSVGPVGYYDMTAAQWLDWAMAQEPRGKNSLAQPEQEPFAYSYLGIKANGEQHGPHLTWKPEYMDAMSASMGAVAVPLYTTPPQRKKLPPQTPCLLTQAENKMFRFGWLECEAAHGIKGDA